MTTTDLKRGFLKAPKRLVALATLWTLLASPGTRWWSG
jgi:hypothetical protein